MQFVAIFLLGLVSVFAAAYGPVVSDGVASTAGDTTASTTISATSTFVEAVFFGGPAFTIKTWGRWLTLETSVSGPETVYGPTSTVYVTENACPVMNRLDRRTEGVASAGTTSMTIAKILSAEGVAPVAAASDIAGQTPSVEGVAHLQGTTTVYACPAESRARRQVSLINS